MPPKHTPGLIINKLKRNLKELEECDEEITTRLKLSEQGGLKFDYIRQRVRDAMLHLRAATADEPKRQREQ